MKFQVLLLLGVLLTASPGIAQDSKENADFKLALNLYNDGLYDLAAEQLRQFINAFPNTSQGVEARFYLGLTQMKLKKYDEARLTFQTFALTYQDNPKAADAWWNVGESYAAAGNNREAALAFERIKVFHAKSKLAPDALVKASQYFSLAGERENARRVLRTVLQEYPSSGAVVQARTQLGKIYFEEGNIDQAQSELKRVIDGDPSAEAQAQALLILGNIYQAVRKTEQAQANYQEILSKYKSSGAAQSAFLNYGKLLAGTGRFAEAADNFRKALAAKTPPDSALLSEALISLGDADAARGDNAAALTSYGKFVSGFPDDARVPEVLWKTALAASRARNFRASNDACNRLAKSTGATEILKRRALVRLAANAAEQKNLPLAAQLYQSFVDQHPDDQAAPEILMRAAGIYEQNLRDTRKAAAAYDVISTRYPRSPLADDALAGAARCYEQLREFDHALQLYKDLEENFPASEFRPAAAQRELMISTFEVKNKDAGLEKLALLVGDVVAEKDRVGLAYRLGEIYFNDLKNYGAAAAQFSSAINSGMTDGRFVDALFYRARAFEYLSWKDESYRPKAIESYQTFLKAYPSERNSEEAALSLFLLEATSSSAAQYSYAHTMALYPNFSRRDSLLLRMGQLQEQSDTLDAALDTYSSIVTAYPRGQAAATAGFRFVTLLAQKQLADSALAEGKRYLAMYPAGMYAASILSLLGDLSVKKTDFEAAAEYYQRLATDFVYTTPGANAKRSLADAYFSAGVNETAISLYSELLQQQESNPLNDSGADPSLLLALGKSYQATGNTQEAKRYLFASLATAPSGQTAGQAYTALGTIYREEKSLDIATAYFRQAERAAPGAVATRDIADMLFESGSYSDAITQYRQLLESGKHEEDARYFEAQIAIALFRKDDLNAGEKAANLFIKKYPEADTAKAAFELERGSYFFRKEDYAKALTVFSNVASKYEDSPSAPAAVYWTGKTLQATGKVQDAIKELERLINQYPQADVVPRAHLALGNIYYDAEKWNEAIKNFRIIVDDPKADPSLLPFAMNNLIETYEIAGVNDAALSLTRKYLELFPNAEDSFGKKIKIGTLYSRLGYYDQAVLHLQSLLDQAGSDLEGEIRYYIAEANFNKGDYQQAILDFLKVPYLVTKKGKLDWTANSLYMSGQSYEKMGRYDQAVTMYQQIIDRNGIDASFKAAARKEIDRVKAVIKTKK